MRAFLAQVGQKSVTVQVQRSDVDALSAGGYLAVMEKDEYDRAAGEASDLAQLVGEERAEEEREQTEENALAADERKTHSIFFHLEGGASKEAERAKVSGEEREVAREKEEVAGRGSRINELVQRKSTVDRMIPYAGRYVALTDSGMAMLSDLTVRNYRVSGSEFSDFVEETKETSDELRSIVQRGSFHVSALKADFPKTEYSQLWSTSMGLAKLQGDQGQISQSFILALSLLLHFGSTIENKMMAAEIMTLARTDSQSPAATLQGMSETLISLDKQLRRTAKVPKQLSAGVAATIMAGRRFDGTYPTDRFVAFCKLTESFESAAILSIANVPADQLTSKFQAFRALFSAWGYEKSEDTELASAFLSISELGGPDDVQAKMTIVLEALKMHLGYPLVAAAILVSIPTLEANETLDLLEKAYALLAPAAVGLSSSELLSLSVRMIHGVRNELVKKIDSTAAVKNTPVQFTYVRAGGFFPIYYPLIIAHASFFATYSGMGGFHPAHAHGVGGFQG